MGLRAGVFIHPDFTLLIADAVGHVVTDRTTYLFTASKGLTVLPASSTKGREKCETMNHPQNGSISVLHQSVELTAQSRLERLVWLRFSGQLRLALDIDFSHSPPSAKQRAK